MKLSELCLCKREKFLTMRQSFIYIIFLSVFISGVHSQNTLDIIGLDANRPGAAVYSIRQLSTSYSGPAIKVRRSLDNAEAFVYFNSANSPASVDAGSSVVFTEGAALSQNLGTVKTGTISTTASKTGTITIAVNKT